MKDGCESLKKSKNLSPNSHANLWILMKFSQFQLKNPSERRSDQDNLYNNHIWIDGLIFTQVIDLLTCRKCDLAWNKSIEVIFTILCYFQNENQTLLIWLIWEQLRCKYQEWFNLSSEFDIQSMSISHLPTCCLIILEKRIFPAELKRRRKARMRFVEYLFWHKRGYLKILQFSSKCISPNLCVLHNHLDKFWGKILQRFDYAMISLRTTFSCQFKWCHYTQEVMRNLSNRGNSILYLFIWIFKQISNVRCCNFYCCRNFFTAFKS
jgi:hypothetical protein